MSGGVVCQCLTGTPKQRREQRPKVWEVTQRYCNHSAFNGYHRTASQWSAVRCKQCNTSWRTKASYVNQLPDMER
jgi:hypothetical protein